MGKNARKKGNTQKHYCPCGGEIKMGGTMTSGRLRWKATCEKCKAEKRKPSDFR